MLRPYHLAALCALFVAQPVFELLLSFPQYFIASGATLPQIILLAIALVIIPTGLSALLLKALPIMATPLLLVFAALLSGQLINALGLQNNFLVLWPLATAVSVILYQHTRFLPSLVATLSPAAILVPALFLYQVINHPHLSGNLLNYAQQAERAPAAPAPVFYLVLDELPRYTLMKQAGQIDRERFPNFARLADQSTWYYNASTVADSTEVALPALLSGRMPDGRNLPASLSAHPNNLFVALAPHMQMNVQEPITRLCPVDVCGDSDNALGQSTLLSLLADSALILLHRSVSPSLRQQLPPIDESWAGFVETESGHKHYAAGDPRFAFLEQVQQAQNPSFNFAHIYLPHVPWKHLPSGKPYATSAKEYRLEGARPNSPRFHWRDDERAIALGYQRHLMQTAYTDQWLGELIDAIQARGLWEQALVIVTADHGLSFKAGMARRWVEDGNMADIMSVPLFVKLPGQENGSVNYGNAQSIDIVATIAEVLKLQTWWSLDGISLTQADKLATRNSKHFQYKRPPPDGGFVSAKLPVGILDDPTILEQRTATFGRPQSQQGLFDVSSDRVWLGQRIASLGRTNISARIDKLQALSNYDADRNNKLPAHLRIELEREFAGLIGIELNGVIRATSHTFSYDRTRLAVILDETFFLQRHNSLALYALMDDGWYEIELESL